MPTKTITDLNPNATAAPGVGTLFLDNGTDPNIAHSGTGSSGHDVFVSGPGQNTWDGAGGEDVVNYSHSASGVDVDLSAGFGFSNDGKISDTLLNIEDVVGSNKADNITLGFGGGHATGGGGADILTAGEGGQSFFAYNDRHDSMTGAMDVIKGFHDNSAPGNGTGDIIDLHGIDQKMGITGHFVGGNPATNIGDISVTQTGGNTFIHEHVDNIAAHDLVIEVQGLHALDASNFHF